VRQCPVLIWQNLGTSRLELPATVPSGLWLFEWLSYTDRPGARAMPLPRSLAHLKITEKKWAEARQWTGGPDLQEKVQDADPAGVWLLRRKLGPFVGLLVPWDSLARRAPPDFDGGIRPGFPMCFLA